MKFFCGNVISSAAIALCLPWAAEASFAEPSKGKLSRSLKSEQPLLTQELVDTLDSIKHTFRVKYAPKDWKWQCTGWNLEEQVAAAKDKALKSEFLSIADCRGILIDFFNSCCDYHVKINFHSTAFSYLPFRVKGSQGHYFVTWIDENLLLGRGTSLQVGDEIVNFDGRPIKEVINGIQSTYFNRGASLTDHALAELFLTLRIGETGLSPEQGYVPIEVIRRGYRIKGNLEWIYNPEEIAAPFIPIKDISKLRKCNGILSLCSEQMKTPFYDAITGTLEKLTRFYAEPEIIDEDFFVLGGRKSYVPVLGKILYRFPLIKPFHAYIYEHPIDRRPIGYLRIPIYESQEGENFKDFTRLIKEFESITDALVIDQVCNPGGELWYAYAIASMLAREPLSMPTHRFTITQEDVHKALGFLEVRHHIDSDEIAKEVFGKTMSGYEVDMEFVQGMTEHCQFIVNQWNAGKSITEPYCLFGIKEIKPNPFCNYTKPILMLIDSLDFSCADLLPAILQDNKRAMLFGTRTGGAGGFVKEHTFPNLLGISSFKYTGSFAERLGQVPLENLGVTPDIIYNVTPTDIRYGHLGYAAAVNQAVNQVILGDISHEP